MVTCIAFRASGRFAPLKKPRQRHVRLRLSGACESTPCARRAQILATKIETRRAQRDNGIRIEFPVAKELVGLVVGKGGRTLGDVKKSTGVELIEVDQNGPRVIVIGPTQETVDAAREMLEFVVERVPVEPEQIGWLIGRGGKNFKELQEKTRVTRLNVDKATSTVILVGTATAVAAAQLYIDTHLEYLAEYDK